jgi:hypothetical protein
MAKMIIFGTGQLAVIAFEEVVRRRSGARARCRA